MRLQDRTRAGGELIRARQNAGDELFEVLTAHRPDLNSKLLSFIQKQGIPHGVRECTAEQRKPLARKAGGAMKGRDIPIWRKPIP